MARAEEAVTALREAIAALLSARGLACSDADQARLAACTDVSTLQRWLLRATSAVAAEDVFSS